MKHKHLPRTDPNTWTFRFAQKTSQCLLLLQRPFGFKQIEFLDVGNSPHAFQILLNWYTILQQYYSLMNVCLWMINLHAHILSFQSKYMITMAWTNEKSVLAKHRLEMFQWPKNLQIHLKFLEPGTVFSHLSLTKILRSCQFSHFRDEENQAQRDQL